MDYNVSNQFFMLPKSARERIIKGAKYLVSVGFVPSVTDGVEILTRKFIESRANERGHEAFNSARVASTAR